MLLTDQSYETKECLLYVYPLFCAGLEGGRNEIGKERTKGIEDLDMNSITRGCEVLPVLCCHRPLGCTVAFICDYNERYVFVLLVFSYAFQKRPQVLEGAKVCHVVHHQEPLTHRKILIPERSKLLLP